MRESGADLVSRMLNDLQIGSSCFDARTARKGLETMFGKKRILTGLLASTAMILGSRAVMADTIDVTNGTSPTQVSPGVYAYNYVVTFDSDTELETGAETGSGLADGGLIFDFGALDTAYNGTGYSITSTTGPAALATDFTVTDTTANAANLNGYQSFTPGFPGFDTFVTTNQPHGADENDFSFVSDVLLSYNGGSGAEYVPNPTPPGGTSTISVTLYSTDSSFADTGTGAGVDNSASSVALGGNATALSSQTIIVPTFGSEAPLPSAAYGGIALIGLMAMGKFMKARRVANA
jgi:hypothetical protein